MFFWFQPTNMSQLELTNQSPTTMWQPEDIFCHFCPFLECLWLTVKCCKKNRIKLSDVRTMGKTKQKYDTKYLWLAIQDQCSYALVQNYRKSIGFSWTAFFTSNLRTIDPICTRFILSGHGSWSISVCQPHFYISMVKKDDILVMWGSRNRERYSFPAI